MDIRETKSHYFIDLNDAALSELVSDARHYADGLDDAPIGIVSSASARLRAISLRQVHDAPPSASKVASLSPKQPPATKRAKRNTAVPSLRE